jgi:hypothetical protein
MLTITIELRVDFDTANKKIKEPIIVTKAKQAAKELITFSELTADKRKPQIMMQVGDMLVNAEEIKLVEDET